MPRTLLLVPTRDSRVHVSIASFLADVCDVETTPMPDMHFDFFPACGINDNYEYSRNVALSVFYQNPGKYDYVLFIDDDQIIGRQVFELYKHDYPITVGRYLNPRYDAGVGLKFFITVFDKTDPETGAFQTVSSLQTKPTEVISGPGGVMLVKAEVFNDERIFTGEPCKHSPDIKPVFRRQLNADGSVRVGEDVDFCIRAAELGYKTLYVPACHVGHWKLMDTMAIESYANRIVNGAMRAMARNPEVINEVQRLCDEEDKVARLSEQGNDAQVGNT